MGGTHLWKALKMIHLLSSPDKPKNVFLFSDGHISDDVSTLASIKKYQQNVRMFTFGVRYVANKGTFPAGKNTRGVSFC